MNYEQAETDIYTRLLPFQGANIEVVKLPETQEDFKRPFAKAKFTVGYKGSKWKDPQSTGHISQVEELLFEIAIQSRTLRGAKGLYSLKKLLTQALVGFTPTDCDKIYAKESGMTGVSETLNDGVWTYCVIVACTTLSVEDFEEDLSVILSRITTNREDENGNATGDVIEVTKNVPAEQVP
jgi:hypothetical protein